jgi:molybdenum cofactor biosynthesis protein B
MNSPSTQQHRQSAPQSIVAAVLTVSDTRTLDSDQGGKLIADLLAANGHRVVERAIVPDDASRIAEQTMRLLELPGVEAVLITGGTGLAARDQTVDAVESLYDASIPGYGELFRMLSFQEIGPAAMLSRASAGRLGQQILITMPGSPNGVRLAMERLILPELPHLVWHSRH